jgi:hypothetical protein
VQGILLPRTLERRTAYYLRSPFIDQLVRRRRARMKRPPGWVTGDAGFERYLPHGRGNGIEGVTDEIPEGELASRAWSVSGANSPADEEYGAPPCDFGAYRGL